MDDTDIQWARTEEHLLNIIQRDGARSDDILLDTRTDPEPPYKTTLDDSYEHVTRLNRIPAVWIDHQDGDHVRPLMVTHMRTWAIADPVKSIPRFFRRVAIVDQRWGSRNPLVEEWETVQHRARANDKKWGVYGVWEKGSKEDGVVIVDASWFVADPKHVQEREESLPRRGGAFS